MGESLFTVLSMAIRVNRSACQVCQTEKKEKKKTCGVNTLSIREMGVAKFKTKPLKWFQCGKKECPQSRTSFRRRKKMTNSYMQIYSIEIFSESEIFDLATTRYKLCVTWHNEYFARQKVFLTDMKFSSCSHSICYQVYSRHFTWATCMAQLCRGKLILLLQRN